MTSTHHRLRQATLLISALVGISALALAGLAASSAVWFVLGFELVLAASAVIGLLFGLGRFPQAPAMTLTLLAGAVATCSVLGYLSTGAIGHTIGPLPLKPVLLARLAIAGILGLGAVLAALGPHSGPWGRLALGAAMILLPTAAAAALFAGPGQSVVGAVASMGAAVAAAAATAAFLTWVGLVAAGGHMIITTFERALPAPWEARPPGRISDMSSDKQ